MKSLLLAAFALSCAAAQTFTEYPIPTRTIAGSICASPDGLFVYFTANTTIGRIDGAGHIREFQVPTVATNAMSLVGCSLSPTGILYFGDQSNYLVYTFDPATRKFTAFKLPTPHSGMAGVLFHSDGLLYIMEAGSSTIHRMQPDGTFLAPIRLSAGRYPHGPSSCAGNVWFAENRANRVAFVTPSGTVSEFLLPTSNSKPFSTVCAPDGGVYFTLNAANQIGRIDTSTYSLMSWSIPTQNSMPKGISLSATGLCFAESNVNKIGCMPLMGGITTESTLALRGAAPNKLVYGPDGDVWFSQSEVSYVARLH
jgi:streptogramin lyase